MNSSNYFFGRIYKLLFRLDKYPERKIIEVLNRIYGNHNCNFTRKMRVCLSISLALSFYTLLSMRSTTRGVCNYHGGWLPIRSIQIQQAT